MSRPIRRNAAVFIFCPRNMKEFPISGHNATCFVYGGRPVSQLYFTLGWALPLPKPAHCRNRCKVPGMDDLTLALKMKRLAAWLDRAWQPAGFVASNMTARRSGAAM